MITHVSLSICQEEVGLYSKKKSRPNTKDSLKVRCTARFRVRKDLNDDKITMFYSALHITHQPSR